PGSTTRNCDGLVVHGHDFATSRVTLPGGINPSVKTAKSRQKLIDRASSWLRFVVERPAILSDAENEQESRRCPLCAWEAANAAQRCGLCGWPLKLRGTELQEGLSKLLRRALRQDAKLAARV